MFYRQYALCRVYLLPCRPDFAHHCGAQKLQTVATKFYGTRPKYFSSSVRIDWSAPIGRKFSPSHRTTRTASRPAVPVPHPRLRCVSTQRHITARNQDFKGARCRCCCPSSTPFRRNAWFCCLPWSLVPPRRCSRGTPLHRSAHKNMRVAMRPRALRPAWRMPHRPIMLRVSVVAPPAGVFIRRRLIGMITTIV